MPPSRLQVSEVPLRSCPRCQHAAGARATHCAACGALLSPTSLPPDGQLRQTTPERREATLLFADLGGYTEWTDTADVEEVVEVMGRIKEGADHIVELHGGIVNQFVGDEVMAVFRLSSRVMTMTPGARWRRPWSCTAS